MPREAVATVTPCPVSRPPTPFSWEKQAVAGPRDLSQRRLQKRSTSQP